MPTYHVYGLTILSPLELPELMPGEGEADVVFRFGEVEPLDPSAAGIERHIQGNPGEVYIFVASAGRFLVRAGREVTVDPVEGAEESVLRVFLLGMVMGIVLHQRGFYIFHAGVAGVDGKAVAFMGARGSGKSTMAAAFHAEGHRLMTDDILALRVEEGVPMAEPGFPRLKLMPDAARYLGEAPETNAEAHLSLRKHSRIVPEGFSRGALPLKRIYLIETAESLEIVPLETKDALRELLPHWYGSQFGMPMIRALGSASHLRQCAEMAGIAPVRRLRREMDLAKFPDLIRMVEEDLLEG